MINHKISPAEREHIVLRIGGGEGLRELLI